MEIASYPLFKYPPYALGLATKLVELVEAYDLELIHAHYAIPHAASAFLAQQAAPGLARDDWSVLPQTTPASGPGHPRPLHRAR